MTDILITGGAGFIGSRLSQRLATDGHRVTILDNFHPQVHSSPEKTKINLQNSQVEVYEGDICDFTAVTEALASSRASLVIHLAAETGTGQSHDMPVRYCETNITGTAHLIEAIRLARRPVERVVLAGTRAVYGEGACVDELGVPTLAAARRASDMRRGNYNPLAKDGRRLTPIPTNSACPPSPNSIYGSTKLMQEYLLQQAFQDESTDVGILRLQNVYGPGQSLKNPYTGVLSIFFNQLRENRVLNIYEDGDITRDFIFVDDVVAAFARIATATQCPREIIDIGTGVGRTIIEVAREMLQLMGLADDRLRISGDFRPGDIRHAVADPTVAAELLNWKAEVMLDEGLGALYEWIKDGKTA